MNDLASFTYTGFNVRTVVRNGNPWFVAVDVCAALGISNARDAVNSLDEDESELVAAAVVTTDARPQDSLNIINEPGLYSLILRSRKPEAKAFKRWITHEVLPALRTTGRYEVPATPQTRPAAEVSRREMALMILAEADRADAAEALAADRGAALAVVAPKAEAWDILASADGDFAVADAAKVLSRDPNIKLGQQRLFNYLGEIGWLYRARGDRRWRVRQDQIETGRLSEIPSSHYHPRTGELVLDPPQVRITAKGLQELHHRLGGNQTAICA